MQIKYILPHRTLLPAAIIANLLILNFNADLQLAHKGTTYWPKYTIKCVGVSIRLPYATETVNLAKPLGNYGCMKSTHTLHFRISTIIRICSSNKNKRGAKQKTVPVLSDVLKSLCSLIQGLPMCNTLLALKMEAVTIAYNNVEVIN